MSAKPVILVVEDSPLVRDTVTENLTEEGYDVVGVANAQEMRDRLANLKPDTILLDLILPDGDGLSLIRNIREYTDVPVIVISGKSDMVDKVVGLEMGADDYIGKPLQMKEVAARIKAQLRRYQSLKRDVRTAKPQKKAEARKMKFGGWVLDREQFQIFDGQGQPGNLTVKEFKLLEAFVMNANKVLSREQLLDLAREGNYNTTDRAIDVQILRVRKKIGDNTDNPEIIKAVRGIGYMFVSSVEVIE